MILSRGATILKSVNQFEEIKHSAVNLKQVRNAWCYRRVPPTDKKWVTISEICGGVMWWWILWNLWHGFDHITGHFEYPRPYEWSDELLGIPPDDDV